MLRKRIKAVLLFVLFVVIVVIISTVIGMYAPVLLCDVWRLPWGICR